MAAIVTEVYYAKKNSTVYGASFKETKKYVYLDASGPSRHMKKFGHALRYLTGERFKLSPVTITSMTGFGEIKESSPRHISNLSIKIPKILFEYSESYQAIVDCCHQHF